MSSKLSAPRKKKKISEAKKNKERIAIIVYRLTLIITGKFEKPRVLKGINQKNIPVHYKSQHNAWMTVQVWFNP